MLKLAENSIQKILYDLPKEARVIDVGAASAPFKRANVLIDIVPYSDIRIENSKGDGQIHSSKETYIQFDICDRKQWPIADKSFDYSICSHVLEDIRDPLWVCSELIRISKAGYIEIPSKLYETSFKLESKKLAGAAHHRWLVDLFENKLRFTFKHFYIHNKAVNKNKKIPDLKNDSMYLKLEWTDSFNYMEQWLGNGKEVFEYFLNKKITDKEKWQIYRKNSPRNIIYRWLTYLKNTNIIFSRIFNRIKQ